MSVIQVNQVSKQIRGARILDDISCQFQGGKVYGLVGKNGAGKTMLLRAIAGLIQINEGSISLDEKELHKDMDILPDTGILLENVGLYPELTSMENLRLLAGLRKKIGDEEIAQAISDMGMDPKDRRSYRKMSLGMKQRILLAQAFMEKPDTLLLDEPTNGLDDSGIELFYQQIRQAKERGAIIILASHSKEDIQILCDEIIYMRGGQITKRVSGSPKEEEGELD